MRIFRRTGLFFRKPDPAFELVVKPEGFALLSNRTPCWSIAWREVVEIAAYKEDLFTGDLVCVEFVRAGAENVCYTVHEDMPGFSELLKSMSRHLPGYSDAWLPKVTLGNIGAKPTLVWRNVAAPPPAE
jgi:hypothetical protein